jgi:hypothetical protein
VSGTPITTKFIDAIQLSERERTSLVRTMEQAGTCERRKHPRVMVEGRFSICVQLEYPGGSSGNFRVQPWDLSRGGLGFFHRAYIHPGTRCTFTGNTIDGQPVSIKGEVVRCMHVAGMVHTVGCKFEMEIDPEIFVGENAAMTIASPAFGVPSALHAGADKHNTVESIEQHWKVIESACAELNAAVNSKQGLDVIMNRATQVATLANTPVIEHPDAPPAAPEQTGAAHADKVEHSPDKPSASSEAAETAKHAA